MAIIYTYPVKGTPLAADLVLISDTADGNKSKNATIASLVTSNAIDVVDTLNSLKGDVSITGGANITVTPSGQNIEISTSASNVDGSGTAYKIPMWSDSNTLTDSQFETASSGSGVLDIPNYIRHIGDTGNFFGFGAALLTAFYMFRMMFVLFSSEATSEPSKNSVKSMIYPMAILTLLSVFAGVLHGEETESNA